jgi:alcohol dehydrogenase class IV
MSFKYYMPTRVFMGNDCIVDNREALKSLGKKAMIVTGAHSAKINGSENDVKKALSMMGITYLVYDKVMSNPTISCAYEGAAIAKEYGVDFIVAIGGGSPMDAGKAIALLAAQEITEENLFSGVYENKILPMAFVPTTAGTGSEVTQYSILTNDKVQSKTSIASDLLFPQVAFLDEKYTEGLPIITTVNTAIDALSHAIEGMLSVRASVVSNALAKDCIEKIVNSIPELQQALQVSSLGKSIKIPVLSPEKREDLLYASFMAGMVIAQTGTTVVHAMGYSLTYFKDIDHGRANGLLLGEYLKLVYENNPDLAEKVLKVMKFTSVNQFIEMLDLLLGKKETISALEILEYSQKAVQTKNMGNCVVRPTEEEVRKIFQASLD